MASTIDATLDGDTTADGRVVRKSELEQQFTAAKADIVALQGATLTAGSGVSGHAETFASGDELIVTRLVIDLTGLNSGDTDGDIIGDAGAANCHIGQYTTAAMGTLVGGLVTCLETPAGGEPDIDLFAADEATGVEDTLITDLTDDAVLLASAGDWTAGTQKVLTALPTANQYLYLVASGGATNDTYTAGRFLLELYGTA